MQTTYLRSQNRINKIVVTQYYGLIATDGSGVLADQFQANPTSAANWSDMTSVWRAYRVMAMELKFNPYERYDSSLSTIKSVMYTSTNHRGTTATPTAASVTSAANSEQRSSEDPWKVRATAYPGSPDRDWTNVGSPLSPAPFSIDLYTSGWAAAGSVGYFRVRYFIEFRDVD